MRLAGVGMIGVVHSTRPIDALQRIIGRVELGMIPSIVDTTIFINEGRVAAIYDVELTVKVPTGMIEADLARPVIEIKDFETGTPVHGVNKKLLFAVVDDENDITYYNVEWTRP